MDIQISETALIAGMITFLITAIAANIFGYLRSLAKDRAMQALAKTLDTNDKRIVQEKLATAMFGEELAKACGPKQAVGFTS